MLEVHEICRCVDHQSRQWFRVSVNYAQVETDCKMSSITRIGVANKVPIDEIGDLSLFTGVNPRFTLYRYRTQEECYYRKKVVFHQAENAYLFFDTQQSVQASYFLTALLYNADSLTITETPKVANDLKQSRILFPKHIESTEVTDSSEVIHEREGYFEPISELSPDHKLPHGMGFSYLKLDAKRISDHAEKYYEGDDSPPGILGKSNDSDELGHFALKGPYSSSQSLLNGPNELSPSRIGGAFKGSSPNRSSSNLKVHFEKSNPEELEGVESLEQKLEQGPIYPARFVRQANASQSLSLWSIASESLLGQWSILVLFLGLVGLIFATYGTFLFYGSSAMAVAGAVGYGISLFHASQEASPANQAHVNLLTV